MLILDGNFKFKINAFAYFCNYEVSDMAMGGFFHLRATSFRTRNTTAPKQPKHYRQKSTKASI
jgi:hypothetical protein